MEQTNNSYPINVEALVSQLLQRGTMTERFKLPMTQTQAKQTLLAAVRSEVESRGRAFTMNEPLIEQTEAIARWLTDDSPQFGLLLCGTCGNGKSTFVKAFQRILNALALKSEATGRIWGMRILDARSIAQMCKSDYTRWEWLCTEPMLAIDDLGIEPLEVLDYGNVMYPIVDLLTRRYDRRLFTIVTTNLTPTEIRDKYGDRIADRLNEMMLKVKFENETYRLL